MNKIDIKKWGEFHLYDEHMFYIDMGNKFDKSKMDTTKNDINFVGRTSINNGINATCGKYNNIEPYKSGLLTLALGGSVGSCFIQQKPFYTSQNVIVLIPKDNISDYAKHFVARVIQKESELHYQAFVKELNAHIKTDFVIPLPINKHKEPDWKYMESYMKEIMQEAEKNIENLLKVESNKNKIDINSWKNFRISELFHTEKKGKNIQVPTGAMLSKKYLKDGETPRVTVSNYNNGITGYYRDLNNKNYRVYENFISVSFLGTVFYHQKRASLDMKVHCLKPIKYELNIYSATFLVNVIRQAISNFAYQDQLSSTLLPMLIIKLPVTSKGEPDWKYMEKYMKSVLKKADKKVDLLNSIVK